MCQFRICTAVLGMRDQGVRQKTWANCLFHNLEQPHSKVARHEGLNRETIKKRIGYLGDTSYATKSNEDIFNADSHEMRRPSIVEGSHHCGLSLPNNSLSSWAFSWHSSYDSLSSLEWFVQVVFCKVGHPKITHWWARLCLNNG